MPNLILARAIQSILTFSSAAQLSLTFLTKLRCKTPELNCIDNFLSLEEHTDSSKDAIT